MWSIGHHPTTSTSATRLSPPGTGRFGPRSSWEEGSFLALLPPAAFPPAAFLAATLVTDQVSLLFLFFRMIFIVSLSSFLFYFYDDFYFFHYSRFTVFCRFFTAQQGVPVTHPCLHSFSSLYHAPSQMTRHSSLCYTAGSHCLSIRPYLLICLPIKLWAPWQVMDSAPHYPEQLRRGPTQ